MNPGEIARALIDRGTDKIGRTLKLSFRGQPRNDSNLNAHGRGCPARACRQSPPANHASRLVSGEWPRQDVMTTRPIRPKLSRYYVATATKPAFLRTAV